MTPMEYFAAHNSWIAANISDDDLAKAGIAKAEDKGSTARHEKTNLGEVTPWGNKALVDRALELLKEE